MTSKLSDELRDAKAWKVRQPDLSRWAAQAEALEAEYGEARQVAKDIEDVKNAEIDALREELLGANNAYAVMLERDRNLYSAYEALEKLLHKITQVVEAYVYSDDDDPAPPISALQDAAADAAKYFVDAAMKERPEREFCVYCGAGIGKHRRFGEGTCPKCDPPADAAMKERT